MDYRRWVADFVRSGGFAHFCEAVLARGRFGDGRPEEMVDAEQACLVSGEEKYCEWRVECDGFITLSFDDIVPLDPVLGCTLSGCCFRLKSKRA